MILGLALAALLAFELLGRLVRAARQKQTRTAAQETADRNESKSETAATPTAEEEANASSSNRRMWLSFGLLIVYTLLIQVLGFAVSSALYLGANLLLLKNSWKSTILNDGRGTRIPVVWRSVSGDLLPARPVRILR
jgi:hypothetical protein